MLTNKEVIDVFENLNNKSKFLNKIKKVKEVLDADIEIEEWTKLSERSKNEGLKIAYR